MQKVLDVMFVDFRLNQTPTGRAQDAEKLLFPHLE